MNDTINSNKICNFCGKMCASSDLSTSFTAGLSICNNCVSSCYSSMHAKDKKRVQAETDFPQDSSIATDAESLKNMLDEYVVGQEAAKRDLSLALSYHLWRKNSPKAKKMNVLLLGPTGTGKSYMVQTLLDKLNIPCVFTDATIMSATGYIGSDAEDAIKDLTNKIDNGFSVEDIRRGVIVIDEVDKIRKISGDRIGISNISVQQELLRLMEGRVVDLRKKMMIGMPSGNFPHATFDTSDLLFIFMGAFPDLYEARKHTQKYLPMFVQQNIAVDDNNADAVLEDEVISAGMLAEFVGRLSILSQLNDLTQEDLTTILIGTARPIVDEFKTYFHDTANIELTFHAKGIAYIVQHVFKKKLGARGLRTYLLKILSNHMFNLMTLKRNNISTLEVSVENDKIVVLENKL